MWPGRRVAHLHDGRVGMKGSGREQRGDLRRLVRQFAWDATWFTTFYLGHADTAVAQERRACKVL